MLCDFLEYFRHFYHHFDLDFCLDMSSYEYFEVASKVTFSKLSIFRTLLPPILTKVGVAWLVG